MPPSRLQVLIADQRREAEHALTQLTLGLQGVGVTLPSLGLDHPSPFTGTTLIELGAVRPDVALQLADVLLRAAAADR
ncbi:hypothetical protein [Kitasatospora viridis]|uniref:Uncharacterized protein n=1 Tax=Kitasatospora viridis TaxID=281105 RepID=A0A561ULA8_9ACTN|nr:hypothetical protein [Kitasatospora viridis]TWG00143.1 hypothetical protein FHX73_114012 [Kitasatospora viridis]